MYSELIYKQSIKTVSNFLSCLKSDGYRLLSVNEIYRTEILFGILKPQSINTIIYALLGRNPCPERPRVLIAILSQKWFAREVTVAILEAANVMVLA